MQGLVCFINTLSIYFVFLEVARAIPSSFPPNPPSHAISKIYVLIVLLEHIDYYTCLHYYIAISFQAQVLQLAKYICSNLLLFCQHFALCFCLCIYGVNSYTSRQCCAYARLVTVCQYTIVRDHVITIISHSCNTFCHHRIQLYNHRQTYFKLLDRRQST